MKLHNSKKQVINNFQDTQSKKSRKKIGIWTLAIGTCLGLIVSKIMLKSSAHHHNKTYQEFEDYLGV